MMRPGTNTSLADIGRNYVEHPRRPERHKAAPVFTEERESRMWADLADEDRERIKAEAKAAAAAVMATWEKERPRLTRRKPGP